MTVFDRIYNAALLPQIKTGSADDAVLAAKAMLSGGVDAMELICRSDDEAAAIAAVQEQCPDMLVGAQCATWEACEKAAESGEFLPIMAKRIPDIYVMLLALALIVIMLFITLS